MVFSPNVTSASTQLAYPIICAIWNVSICNFRLVIILNI